MPDDLSRAPDRPLAPDYPLPIVDHATAYRVARQRMGAVRSRQATRDEARRVYEKHGSRRRPRAKRSSPPSRQA